VVGELLMGEVQQAGMGHCVQVYEGGVEIALNRGLLSSHGAEGIHMSDHNASFRSHKRILWRVCGVV
jgi:hypothetical protein